MARSAEKAYTVAELLATVGIIAVLALMLLPALDAKRAEARTVTCQANMQKVLSALRMYMADHDNTLPPREHRPEALDYFNARPGGRHGSRDDGTGNCRMAQQANPYLRWPVVLEPYLPSRDVWQCPSATVVRGATWIVPGPDWLHYLMANEGLWGIFAEASHGPCYFAWPPGWGGTVTDSIVQQRLAVGRTAPLYGTVADGAFVQSIGINLYPELRMYEVTDPSAFVIVADGGVTTEGLSVGTVAYPDICALECGNSVCGWADWEICGDAAASCGLYRYAPNNGSLLANVSLRAPYARHRRRFSAAVPMWERNGVNVGFMDGHVRWIASEDLVAKVRDKEYDGLRAWGPTSECGFSNLYPYAPALY